jgi:dCTP deaminase
VKNLLNPEIDKFRDRSPAIMAVFGSVGGATEGAFLVPSPIDGAPIRVIASVAGGWDHVSASRANRCPNWPEMSHLHRLFFGDEPAMQLHVPSADHINIHPNTLHLWRPHRADIPMPPYGLGPHGYDIRIAQDVRLWWGVTKLASSVERFNLPNNIRGLTLNKSTWRRRSLEVGAATILEAGWQGYLTLELTLLRPLTLFIPAGTPIAQVEFAWLDMPTDRPYVGKYQDQPAQPVPARLSQPTGG